LVDAYTNTQREIVMIQNLTVCATTMEFKSLENV